jgi:hypothetical protein
LLPLPAPANQPQRAEAGGEQRECGRKRGFDGETEYPRKRTFRAALRTVVLRFVKKRVPLKE